MCVDIRPNDNTHLAGEPMTEQQNTTPDGTGDLAALEGEVLTEREYPDGTVQVALADKVVHILPPDEWTSGAHQDLTEGRLDAWAEDCLAGDDYDTVWSELNDGRGPKIRDIEAMFAAWTELTGQSAGKSRSSQRFSKRGRRR
jgi:hypothetical protein